MNNYEYCVFLDAGHGGIRPDTGYYTTQPSKMFTHEKGKFHNGSTFYEGVKNREYADEIAKRLMDKGINVIKTYHPWEDTPLSRRVELANYYHSNIQKGIFFSEHSNASTGAAKGMSVWTSIGQTTSDFLAEEYLKFYKADLSDDGIRVREQDYEDGDGDYEENFYVLRNTNMPAVLSENLFFDNFDDARLLMDDYYKEQYIQVTVAWLEWAVKYMSENA
jgi:N-acetylmuramoyl-L-alanine amidase